jgi:hypothetical protein
METRVDFGHSVVKSQNVPECLATLSSGTRERRPNLNPSDAGGTSGVLHGGDQLLFMLRRNEGRTVVRVWKRHPLRAGMEVSHFHHGQAGPDDARLVCRS